MERSQSIVKDSHYAGSANGAPATAAQPIRHPLLRLQSAVGNRAVRSLIPGTRAGSQSPTQVQRSWLDDVGDFVSDAGSAIASGVGSVVDAGESVASDVASGVSNVASDAWSGVKSVAGDVADVGSDIYGAMKKGSSYVQKGVGAVGEGIDWLEDEAKGGTHWLAEKAEGIPVLEQLAGGAESLVDTSVDITGGALKGVTGLAGGIANAVVDPVDTAKALYTMSEHIPGIGLPAKALHGAYDLAFTDKSLGDVADETLNPMNDLKYWGNVGKGILSPMEASIKAGKSGEAAGQAGVLIASLFTGAGEAGAAGEGAEIAEAAEAAEAAEGAEAAEAAQSTEAAEAADAAAATGEPVQVPVEPGVNPTGPTQMPPTELPPDFLESPQIPKPPKLPEFTPEELEPFGPEPEIETPEGELGESRGGGGGGAGGGEGGGGGSVPGGRTPDDEFNDFMQMLKEEGVTGDFEAAGTPVSFVPYGGAGEARELLGVTGEEAQAAHIMPQSLGRANVPGYDPNAALTMLEDPAVHRSMDQPWIREFEGGYGETSGQDAFETISNSFQQSQLEPGVADTLRYRLEDEMFVEHGLGRQETLSTPSAPEAAESEFEGLGMQGDERRLYDSETGEYMPRLGEEAEGEFTARPKPQSLEGLLDERAVRDFLDRDDDTFD